MMRKTFLHLLFLLFLVACQRAELDEGLPGVRDLAIEDPGTGNMLRLSWTNPSSDLATAIHIVRFAGTCIDDPAAGSGTHFDTNIAGAGREQGWADTSPDDEIDYCYAVFVKYGTQYSKAATVNGQSTDATPPGPVAGLQAEAGLVKDSAIHLSWTSPIDADLTTIRILRRAGQAPDGYDDAEAREILVLAAANSYRDAGIVDGVAYYYTAWALDEKENHSEGVTSPAVTRLVDDDGDGLDETQGDCDDSNGHIRPGSTLRDCGTDYDCDGNSLDTSYCQDYSPATDAQCASAGVACEPDGCTWWLDDQTACDDGDAGTADEVCVAGACVAGCQVNSRGYHDCRPAGTRGGALVVVPAGHFWMGCNEFARSCAEDWRVFEVPYHRVFLDTYGIDKTEVTLADYQACIDDGACTAPATASGCFQAAQHPDLPAACTLWAQAQNYCTWAGKRLCTEAEWEKAARGLDAREYPWGDVAPTCDLAVFDATGTCTQERWDFCGCGAGRGWDVGSKPDGDSFYGVSDMAGNLWEWVSDWRDVDYYSVSPERNPEGPVTGQYKVGRGGGYADPGIYIYSSLRGTLDPTLWGVDVGFRCCKSLPDR